MWRHEFETLYQDKLERFATLRAEYRDHGEAGVFAQGRSDLLVANWATGRIAGCPAC